jgi:hypothetical protein
MVRTALTLAAFLFATAATAADRPNIALILADDQDYKIRCSDRASINIRSFSVSAAGRPRCDGRDSDRLRGINYTFLHSAPVGPAEQFDARASRPWYSAQLAGYPSPRTG